MAGQQELQQYPVLETAQRQVLEQGAGLSEASWWRSSACLIIKFAIDRINKKVDINIARSLGMLTQRQVDQLASSGVHRYNHNLETACSFFPRQRPALPVRAAAGTGHLAPS